MIRRAFFAAIGLSCAMLLGNVGLEFGPSVESRLFPVRNLQTQEMQFVTRADGRLCWEWVNEKIRPLVSDELDAVLITSRDRITVAPFERETGEPWARSRAVGLGQHRQPYCILLPPSVRASDVLRVEQVAWYPGFWGLWRLPLRLPDVVDPKGGEAPL